MARKYSTTIVFWGTPDFAVSILEKLQEKFSVLGVITNPDEPRDRNAVLTSPPTCRAANRLGIPVYQPEKIIEENWSDLNIPAADFFVVAAYGKIIPKWTLNLPTKGAINVHPSLLPKWRGASPIQHAILNGDVETGATIILMDEKMDHGPILAQRSVKIPDTIAYPELSRILSEVSGELLVETIPKLVSGTILTKPQDDSHATFCRAFKREDGKIDWSRSASEIERAIRAFTPWPGTFTLWKRGDSRDIRLKILQGHITEELPGISSNALPGRVIVDTEHLYVVASPGFLEITLLQPEGKTPMQASAFLKGYDDINNALLH